MGRRNPREVLIIHNDMGSRVSRYIVAILGGQGFPVSHRNLRYSYHAPLYRMVIVVGIRDVTITNNMRAFPYTPYSEYYRNADKENCLDISEYQLEAAEKIADMVILSLS